jgi:radical SAM superfamily enzyme YgiQ (UPF0313 family)
MPDVLLVSTFEGGFQPLSVASATRHLLDASIDVGVLDTYVDGVDDRRLGEASLVAVAIPLFDSIRPGIEIARRVRSANPKAHVTFFGQYATISPKLLAGKYCDSTIVGEWDGPLTALASRTVGNELRADTTLDVPGLFYPRAAPAAVPAPYFPLKKSAADASRTEGNGSYFRVPARHLLPGLDKYPQPQVDKLCGEPKVVGGTEITRGCHHACSYCSVVAAYGRRVLVVPEDVVVEDVRNLVRAGMTHLTFQDAEFINAKHHGIRILRRLHAEFPDLTYDLTTRMDHVLENQDVIREMAELGVKFITSALEFPSQRMLDAIEKDLTVEQISEGIQFLRTTSIKLNPTFIMFNPWSGLEDMIGFRQFVEDNELDTVIDPIQYETRLNIYKGSPLLQSEFIRSLELTEQEFHHDWKHPDPRVDELYAQSVTPPQEGIFKRCCLKC